MSRPKLKTPTTVYIVTAILYYDGQEILGVHTSVETAQAAHPDKWKHVPATEHTGEYWTAKGHDFYDEYQITPFDLKP